jgi:hypothetical protein
MTIMHEEAKRNAELEQRAEADKKKREALTAEAEVKLWPKVIKPPRAMGQIGGNDEPAMKVKEEDITLLELDSLNSSDVQINPDDEIVFLSDSDEEEDVSALDTSTSTEALSVDTYDLVL